MSKTTTETRIRQLLELRERQLDAEIAAARLREEPAPREVGDMKDGADRSALAEVATAEVARDVAELQALRAARRRLDDGSYGVCQDCGEPIGAARLQAQPTAARCLSCQGAAEQHAGLAAH